MMAEEPTGTIELFYCYARKDKELRDELDIHLKPLQRSGQITSWYDGEITPGTQWEEEIRARLDTADIILLLISPDFIASDYCYGKEMTRAIARHTAGDACVIPILLRPTYWQQAPFRKLQMLPRDAKPITLWLDRDEALEDVTRGIVKVIEKLTTKTDNSSPSYGKASFPISDALASAQTARVANTAVPETQATVGAMWSKVTGNSTDAPEAVIPASQATQPTEMSAPASQPVLLSTESATPKSQPSLPTEQALPKKPSAALPDTRIPVKPPQRGISRRTVVIGLWLGWSCLQC